jgi:hypothetical protein
VRQNPVIPRAQVHRLSEACAALPNVEVAARRALDGQPRLARFFRANMPQMAAQPAEVSLYLLSVVIRVFEGSGGVLKKVGAGEIEAATGKLAAVAGKILPGDEGLPLRVRAVGDRAQPNLLDEALEALFEREKNLEKEVDIPPDQSALVFLMLWAATEALDDAWSAPASPAWLADAS